MPTFLVATDGSETAELAAERAAEEADVHGADLVAVTVLDAGAYSRPKSGGWQDFYESVREIAEEHVESVRSMAEERGVRCETEVLEGTAHDRITEFAEETGADQIFVGTVGRSGLRETFLGSTAERVVRHAGVPVTVVPGER